MDYAGPFEGHYLLTLIDAHSKLIEAYRAKSPSPSVTIELLLTVFAQFGLSQTVVLDNSSCFVSKEFQKFFNGIKQDTSAPKGHPNCRERTKKDDRWSNQIQNCKILVCLSHHSSLHNRQFTS